MYRLAPRWKHYSFLIALGGVLWGSGYLTARYVTAPSADLLGSVQAQEAPKHHDQSAQAHDHGTHEDLAPFMVRNAYHFSTLYHAGRAARWELAAYQAEELLENLEDAAGSAPTFAAALRDYQKDFVQPLQEAITARQMAPFTQAFRAAVQGCNDCHKAHKHSYIVIPEAPPNMSIFTLTPANGTVREHPTPPESGKPKPPQDHKH